MSRRELINIIYDNNKHYEIEEKRQELLSKVKNNEITKEELTKEISRIKAEREIKIWIAAEKRRELIRELIEIVDEDDELNRLTKSKIINEIKYRSYIPPSKMEIEKRIIEEKKKFELERKRRENLTEEEKLKNELKAYVSNKYGGGLGILLNDEIDSGILKTKEEIDCEVKIRCKELPEKVETKSTIFIDESYSKRKRQISSNSDFKEDHKYWKELYG